MKIAVLIPAHNEALTIRAIAEGALKAVRRVVVIDDGSVDGTAEALGGLAVEIIRHDQNAGKGQRLSEGLSHCFEMGSDGVVTIDADGQHDVGDIPALISAADPEAIVLADRTADMAQMPSGRSRANRVARFFVTWGCQQVMRDTQCGLRLYPAGIWSKLDLSPRDCRHFVFETAVLLHAADQGARFVWVPIKARYAGFQHRPSHFRPVIDILRITGAVGRFIVSRGFQSRGLLIALGLMR